MGCAKEGYCLEDDFFGGAESRAYFCVVGVPTFTFFLQLPSQSSLALVCFVRHGAVFCYLFLLAVFLTSFSTER